MARTILRHDAPCGNRNRRSGGARRRLRRRRRRAPERAIRSRRSRCWSATCCSGGTCARMLAARGIAHLNVRFVQAQELAQELARGRRRCGGSRGCRRGASGCSCARRRRERAATSPRSAAARASPTRWRGCSASWSWRRLAGGLRARGRGARSRRAKATSRSCASWRGCTPGTRSGERVRGGAGLLRARPTRRGSRDRCSCTGSGRSRARVLSLIERVAAVAPVTVFLPRRLMHRTMTRPRRCASVLLAARRVRASDAERTRRRRAVGPGCSGLTDERAGPRGGAGHGAGERARHGARGVGGGAHVPALGGAGAALSRDGGRVSQPRSVRALVDEIFREAGIETYLHDGRLLAAHPLGRRLLALIELAADGDFSRARVMEFLTETRVSQEMREAYARSGRASGKAFTREAGIIAGMEQWRDRLTGSRARSASWRSRGLRVAGANTPSASTVLRQFVADFHAALKAHPEEATWDEHLAYLRRSRTRVRAGYGTGRGGARRSDGAERGRGAADASRCSAARCVTTWSRATRRACSASRCASSASAASPCSMRRRCATCVFARCTCSASQSARGRRRRGPTRCCWSTSARRSTGMPRARCRCARSRTTSR